MKKSIFLLFIICVVLQGCKNFFKPDTDMQEVLKPDENSVPYIEVKVNKNICLYEQLYDNKELLHLKSAKEFLKSIENIKKSTTSETDFHDFLKKYAENDQNNRFMTNEFVKKYKTTLTDYDSYFNSSYDRLIEKCNELQLFCNSKFKSGFFKNIFDFYGIEKRIKFEVYLYPSGSEKAKEPTSLKETIFMKTSEIPTHAKASMLVREICKILYKNNPNHAKILRFFSLHKSEYAIPTYILLNEAISHFIAQDWFMMKIKEKKYTYPQKNEYIEPFSKSISELISKYIDSRDYMDNDFFEECIKKLKQTSFKISNDIKILIKYPVIIAENNTVSNIVTNILLKDFELDEKLISYKFDEKDIHRTIISVGKTTKNIATFEISGSIPNKDSAFLFITKNSNGKIFIIINSSSEEKIRKAFNIIKDKKISFDNFFFNL